MIETVTSAAGMNMTDMTSSGLMAGAVDKRTSDVAALTATQEYMNAGPGRAGTMRINQTLDMQRGLLDSYLSGKGALLNLYA